MNQENQNSDNTKSCALLNKGTEVGHYRIIRRVRAGGMGEVYLAEDTKLHRKVALKFLGQQLNDDKIARARFVREARAVASLDHPNVVTIYEVGEFNGRPFFAMQFIAGNQLSDHIAAEKLTISEIIQIAIQIAEGLQAAHKKGIVHRDLKPSNILIDNEGRARVADFGLARTQGDTKLTETGSTIGTYAYMSPEQASGKAVDQRSDIFSYGVVLYEIITSKRPFKGDDNAAVLHSITHDKPEPLSRYKANVPESLQAVVDKALQKEPSLRYQSAADVLADLRRFGAESVKKKNQKRLLLTATSIALITCLGGYFIYSKYNSQKLIGMQDTADYKVGKSIAVMPFLNMSGDKENEYFSDGITEDIITQISKISELRVIARTSTMSYKKSDKPVREIGKELNVATILEGSVRRVGNQVRISAQLIDAKTEGHIWAETFDKEMSQIFILQNEIARQIAAALKARLSPAERARLANEPTTNLIAYDYYLKGREYYNRYNKQDNEYAISLFKKALELDSNYALAYAGLGDAYCQRIGKFGFPFVWKDSAIEASNKAITIDTNLAEGYKALGLSYTSIDNREALRAYQRAIEINPNYAVAISNIGQLYEESGKLDEALKWRKKAMSVAPMNAPILYRIGKNFMDLGDDEKAEQYYKKSLELQPDLPLPYRGLSYLNLLQGNYLKAFELVNQALTFDSNTNFLDLAGNIELLRGNYPEAKDYYLKTIAPDTSSGNFTGLAFIYLKTGQEKLARQIIDNLLIKNQELLDLGKEDQISPLNLATIYAIQDNKAEAYRWLMEAIDRGWRNYRWASIDPQLENLHNDEKFQKMMADVKAKVDEMRRRAESE